MTIARRLLVDEHKSGIYHCISRCVRRAYLCGGQWEHRREWIHDRLIELTGIFGIDVGGYAVMENHLHVVARTAPERVRTWTNLEVAERWLVLYPKERTRILLGMGRRVSKPTAQDRAAAASSLSKDRRRIKQVRERLSSLSWFMKCLKEPIAHRANREDGCKGHFWEARFKSPRILDLAGLLSALVYVDLNVIRAAIASTPEESLFTSAHDRIQFLMHFEKTIGKRRRAPKEAEKLFARHGEVTVAKKPRHAEDGIWLAPIEKREGETIQTRCGLLPMTPAAYLTLLDEVGRQVRKEGTGAIPAALAPIMKRLKLNGAPWLEEMKHAGELVGTVVGTAANCAKEAMRRGTQWVVSTFEIDEVAAD